MNIQFICTGNTCRSPMAAALYASLSPEDTVGSAGLAAAQGQCASAHMLALAPEFGVDLSAHRSRRATGTLLAEADVVVCLSASHALHLAPLVPEHRLRILGGGIPDPYGGTREDYRACALGMQAVLPALHRELQTTGIEIVPMQEEHLSPAAALEQQCFSLPWSERSLRDGMQSPHAHYIAACSEGRLAGYLGISQIADQADIANIAVNPAHRRLGIASALMARAETAAILRGCRELRLEARESNAAALALYRGRGYEEAGRRRQYYKHPEEDSVLLTLFVH